MSNFTSTGCTPALKKKQSKAMRRNLAALDYKIEKAGCIMEALVHGLVDRHENYPNSVLADQVYAIQSAWEDYSAAVYDAGVLSSDLLNL